MSKKEAIAPMRELNEMLDKSLTYINRLEGIEKRIHEQLVDSEITTMDEFYFSFRQTENFLNELREATGYFVSNAADIYIKYIEVISSLAKDEVKQ